jgi:EmrB/QacA subfamily drug resistance transporter
VPAEAATPAENHSYGSLVLFLAVSFGLFMVTLDNLVVSTALNTIRLDLNATLVQLEWTVNAYTLTFAVFLITGAALGDRFGRKRIFVLGLVVFTAASLAAALSTTPEALVAARAVQGIGGAMIMPISLVILNDAFPPEKRAMVVGLWSGVAGLGVAIGPLVGGAVVEGISWHWIFWLNVPVGLVLIPLVLRTVRESHGPYDRLDPLGLVLISIGMFSLVWGLMRGHGHGWGSTEIVSALISGVVFTTLFVLWERRTAAPMLPMRFFRNRTFALAQLVSLLFYFGLFGCVFLLVQFLQAALGYSPLQAGVRTLPWTGVPMFIAPVAALVASRLGGGRVIAAGMLLLAGGFAWQAAVISGTVDYVELVPGLLLAGIGMGLYFSPIAYTILSSVRQVEAGQASGAHSATREVGGVFGIAILATIFSAYGGFGSPQHFADGVVPALWVATGVMLVGAVAAFLIPRPTPIEELIEDEVIEGAQPASAT